jgi:hypothetical protein
VCCAVKPHAFSLKGYSNLAVYTNKHTKLQLKLSKLKTSQNAYPNALLHPRNPDYHYRRPCRSGKVHDRTYTHTGHDGSSIAGLPRGIPFNDSRRSVPVPAETIQEMLHVPSTDFSHAYRWHRGTCPGSGRNLCQLADLVRLYVYI